MPSAEELTVAGRTLLQKRRPKHHERENRIDPILLRFCGRFRRSYIFLHALANDISEVLSLLTCNMDEVRRKRCLRNGNEEAVWKPSCRPPMERTSAFLVSLCKSLAVAAVNLHVTAVGEVCCQLEAGGIDDAVEIEFFAIGDDASFGDVIDPDA